MHPGVADVAGALTPVPGGVGPLTIAMLLKNTVAGGTLAGRVAVSVLRAALTGGIATGKSYCLARFAALGVPTIDADTLARDAVAPGSPGLAAVAARFGPGILPRGRHPRSRGAGAHRLRAIAPRAPTSRRSSTPTSIAVSATGSRNCR